MAQTFGIADQAERTALEFYQQAETVLARAEFAYRRANWEEAHGRVPAAREWRRHAEYRMDEHDRLRDRARRLEGSAYIARLAAA
ncbi:hypothetical protein FNH13_17605 [Ornithinimicrobium ciconiae]|uniref:Uncharacterized protein n=1 Tax=Ornithinimicrobium ciconiae TaxID=2594265 RepID=A0A516GEF5_9MICO|nr:hypothetical protein [Ornithinimicrobium ciconiae]QDO89917.1 hypothetical protein FNH13_17605 [Ornithinimicrobium ciconiae]